MNRPKIVLGCNNYRWIEYDPLDHTVVWVPYEEDGWIKICHWVKYDLKGPNPKVTGTKGLMRVIYETDLHANPCPTPNYGDPYHFCNNVLQIFYPDYGSYALVDQALTQIRDPSLSVEVV